MRPRLITFALYVVASLTTHGQAAELPDVAPWLERKLLAADQSLQDVQAFVEARLPPLPMPRDPADWQQYADGLRQRVLDRVVFRGEAARWRDAPPRVEWLDSIPGGTGYSIRKLRYEAVPGMWIPALLYVPDKLDGRVPAILNVNGHDRTGKAAKYKQIRCVNLAKRGMLVLNPEWLGMGQLSGDGFRHGRMNQLDLCGTSGLAPFYLAMSRGIDVLLSHENVDPQRVAVAGLSGGGWQTITISSLDPRVKLCNPVAGYSSFRTRLRNFSDLGDSEQTPCDLATVADYEHLTAILAPRPALLTYNFKDECCFAAGHALPPLVDAARPVYKLFGQELRLRWHVNHHPGTHNFDIENREALYRMIGDFFYPDLKGFDSQEIPCDAELKSAEELSVPLPDGNQDFHTLALRLAEALPLPLAVDSDRDAERSQLAKLVRAVPHGSAAERVEVQQKQGVTCTWWRLRVGEAWTVPVTELAPPESRGTVIVVADEGRAASAGVVKQLLESRQRVLAIDPFYFGENKLAQRAYLFALLTATVGERPLGIQASQLNAVARWQRELRGDELRFVAIGPRCGLIAQVAAALEPELASGVELHGEGWSLKTVIEKNLSYEQSPELFCFGLLERFDTDRLARLIEPRAVRRE